jgi:hypothetical protein
MNIIDKLLGRKTKADSHSLLPRRPEWMATGVVLPPWAKISDEQYDRASIHIEIDSDVAYAYWLGLLDNPELDQYWLEVAYQCIKLDLDAALLNTEHDMRFAERHIARTFTRATKYAQAQYPVGRSATVRGVGGATKTLSGANLASQGLEARDHYKRIRGQLPS